MSDTTKPKKTRVTFDFMPEAYARLGELQTKTGASSKAEVVRKALSLYDTFLQYQDNGGGFLLRNSEGKEIQICFL